jgi:hypothetical protein
MAQPILPVLKSVYICDDVVDATRKVPLLNLWTTVRVPSDAAFPYTLTKLCVFAWCRGGQGRVKTRVDIVRASTGMLIHRTPDFLVHFVERNTSVFAKYKIECCQFKQPDDYFVEFYCEGEFIDDQVIRVYQE